MTELNNIFGSIPWRDGKEVLLPPVAIKVGAGAPWVSDAINIDGRGGILWSYRVVPKYPCKFFWVGVEATIDGDNWFSLYDAWMLHNRRERAFLARKTTAGTWFLAKDGLIAKATRLVVKKGSGQLTDIRFRADWWRL